MHSSRVVIRIVSLSLCDDPQYRYRWGSTLGSLASSTASTAITRRRGRASAGAGVPRAIADPNASRGHGPGQAASAAPPWRSGCARQWLTPV